MDAVDDTKTLGRARLDFASEHDIDEFVETLARFESGEMPADQWRRYRLVRGTYGQRQDGVQMLRVKAPQGIVSSSQMRAFAGVASRYSRGFCHITTRQNIQFHFVLLKNVEAAMRELADEGLTTREACGNSVRNVTGCPYAGTSETEIFDPSPYAEALTRYFLRHPLSGVLPRKFKAIPLVLGGNLLRAQRHLRPALVRGELLLLLLDRLALPSPCHVAIVVSRPAC